MLGSRLARPGSRSALLSGAVATRGAGRTVEEMLEVVGRRYPDATLAERPLRIVERTPPAYERHVKPLLDRVLAATLLVLLAPLLLAVALAVRVSLGPGVIYRQERIGRGGAPVQMLKFRTMRPDRRRDVVGRARPDRRSWADRRAGERRQRQAAFAGPDRRRARAERRAADRRAPHGGRRNNHKSLDDPRHTRLGRFLRATSMDELPQLVNVLRGELSLVGPRPELPEIVATYEPWQHARHTVKPGLTGLWQVTERGLEAPMHEHVDTDLRYVAHLSLLTDLRILLLTPMAILGLTRAGRGS